jgi:hypothetical protein
MATAAFCVLLLLLGLPQDPGNGGQLIPLRDGQIVVGEITSHDEEGIEVRRLDNGGVVELSWSHLAPPEEKRLRSVLGYEVNLSEEVMIEADEVVQNDGTRKVGILEESTRERIRLREKESVWQYTPDQLQGPPKKVRVPALAVFTREQLYDQRLAATDTTSAASNLELARYCEQIRNYGKAIEHLKKVTGGLARNAESAKRQAEEDHIGEIEIQRNRKKWDLAIQLCEEFPTKFPKSARRADIEKRRANILVAKKKDMVRRTFENWYPIATALTRKKGEDRKIGFSAAQDWASGDMKKEIRAAVAKALKGYFPTLTEDEASALWPVRLQTVPGPTVKSVSYGAGTFALGKAKALEGIDKREDPKKKGPVKSKEEEEMDKKMKRFFERQQGSAQGGEKKPETPDEWWEKASSVERQWWLMAYYAEFGGDMVVVEKRARPCYQCGGKGKIEFLLTGGAPPPDSGGGRSSGGSSGGGSGSASIECNVCHGVAVERVISYR